MSPLALVVGTNTGSDVGSDFGTDIGNDFSNGVGVGNGTGKSDDANTDVYSNGTRFFTRDCEEKHDGVRGKETVNMSLTTIPTTFKKTS